MIDNFQKRKTLPTQCRTMNHFFSIKSENETIIIRNYFKKGTKMCVFTCVIQFGVLFFQANFEQISSTPELQQLHSTFTEIFKAISKLNITKIPEREKTLFLLFFFTKLII